MAIRVPALLPAVYETTARMPYWVYIMMSGPNGTLYTGVTRDLSRRVWEHQNGFGSSFVRRYGVTKLAWAEAFDDVNEAIATEKRIKRWRRAWKVDLIRKSNPKWDDLTSTLH